MHEEIKNTRTDSLGSIWILFAEVVLLWKDGVNPVQNNECLHS